MEMAGHNDIHGFNIRVIQQSLKATIDRQFGKIGFGRRLRFGAAAGDGRQDGSGRLANGLGMVFAPEPISDQSKTQINPLLFVGERIRSPGVNFQQLYFTFHFF